jgi:hypothetical protein
MGMMVFLTFVIMRIFYHAFDRHRHQHNSTTTATTTTNNGANNLISSTSSSIGDHISKTQSYSNNLRTTTATTGKLVSGMGSVSASAHNANSSTQHHHQQQQQHITYLEKKKKKRLEKEQNPLTLGLNPFRYQDQENILHSVAMTWEQFLHLPTQPPRHTLSIPHSITKRLKVCSFKNSGNINITANSNRKGCNNIWNDQFLNSWKTRKVKGLCEDNANSKVRDCIF